RGNWPVWLRTRSQLRVLLILPRNTATPEIYSQVFKFIFFIKKNTFTKLQTDRKSNISNLISSVQKGCGQASFLSVTIQTQFVILGAILDICFRYITSLWS
ncbi:unnamed protein product, partial [Tenebrio molitor]